MQKYFSKRKTYLTLIFLLFAIFAAYTFLFFNHLTTIGPEYDEALYVNAALGCPNKEMFLHLYFPIGNSCLPVMVMPYLGATHAYILKFFFWIFGADLFALRFTNYILMLASLILVFLGTRRSFGKHIALIVLVLLVFDPQLFLSSRLDRTIATPFFLKSLLVFLLLYPFKKFVNLKYSLLGFLVGLMIFTKSDVLFVILSLLLASIFLLIVDRKNMLSLLKKKLHTSRLAVFAMSFLFGISPYLLYLHRSLSQIINTGEFLATAGDLPIVAKTIKKLFYILTQFSGQQMFEVVFRQNPIHTITWLFSGLLLLSIIVAIYKSWKKSVVIRLAALTFGFFYLFILGYGAFGGWGKSHHLILIYPIPQIILAYYLVKNKLKWGAISLTILLVVNFITSYSDFSSLSKSTCGRVSWSCNIREVASTIKKLPNPIVVGDWGIATQLLLLTGGEKDIIELVFKADQSSATSLAPTMDILKRQCSTFVLFSPEHAIFLRAREAIIPNLEKDPNYSKMIVYNKELKPYAEIYNCK